MLPRGLSVLVHSHSAVYTNIGNSQICLREWNASRHWIWVEAVRRIASVRLTKKLEAIFLTATTSVSLWRYRLRASAGNLYVFLFSQARLLTLRRKAERQPRLHTKACALYATPTIKAPSPLLLNYVWGRGRPAALTIEITSSPTDHLRTAGRRRKRRTTPARRPAASTRNRETLERAKRS
jgi:hypothetical protein